MVPEEIHGRIESIALRPIKSCAKIDVQDALLTEDGLEGDHNFVVVSAKPVGGAHEFVSQWGKRDDNNRAEGTPLLARVKLEYRNGDLWVSWSGEDAIQIPSDKDSGDDLRIRIWTDETIAIGQGELLDQWFSDHLEMQVKLAKAAGGFDRLSRRQPKEGRNGLRTQDGYPILWFSEASLQELSQRSGQQISRDRFRPQITISGLPDEMPAQVEHKLYALEVAGMQLTNEKPCVRCPITMVDQVTGEFGGPEPLKTLATYKMWVLDGKRKGVVFGENANPHGRERIRVGDSVQAISLRETPPIFVGLKGK